MSDGRDDNRRLWAGPAAAWLGLLALLTLSLGSAYLPFGRGNVAINLAVAVAMLAVLVTFLMDLRNSPALIRIAAGAGVFWLVFLFALTFVDYLSRSY